MKHDDFSCDVRKWSDRRLYTDKSGFEAVRLEKERRAKLAAVKLEGVGEP